MQQTSNTIMPGLRQSSRYPDFQHAGNKESGIVLAVVLILLGVIVALVLHAQVLARSCLNFENKGLVRTQLRETAGDGAWHALNVLAADQTLLIDHTNEEWAAPIHIRLPSGIDTEVMIIDENRFVDANMLAYVSPSEQWRPPAAVVRELLAGELSPARNATHSVAGGMARELGQASNPELQTMIIQDWVDKNLEGSYEAEYYRRLAEQVEVANSPMASREELLWLLKATTNTAAKTTALTILPAQEPRIEPVNVNTASRQTLLAVLGDNNAGLVERIIHLRNAAPILTLDQVIEPAILQKFAAYLSVRSSFFSVYSKAETGVSAEAVYCLAKRDQTGNIQIIRWVER